MFGVWVWKAAQTCSRWWSSHHKLSGMEDYCKLLLQVPIVLTLSKQAGFGSLRMLTCSNNKVAYWRWIPGCSRKIKGRNKNSIKQKSREQRLRSCPGAWFPVSTLDHTLEVVCQELPPEHTPPACLDHPAAWEVRSRRMRGRLGLPLSAAVQASVLQLLRPALL